MNKINKSFMSYSSGGRNVNYLNQVQELKKIDFNQLKGSHPRQLYTGEEVTTYYPSFITQFPSHPFMHTGFKRTMLRKEELDKRIKPLDFTPF